MRGRICLLLAGLFLVSATHLRAEVKVSGDCFFVPRYELETHKDNTAGAGTTEKVNTNMRLIYRARLNVTAKLTDGFGAGMRLASDSGYNAITMPDIKGVFIDRAYITYTGMDKCLKISGGMTPLKGNLILDTNYYPDDPVNNPWAKNKRDTMPGVTVDYKLSDDARVKGIFIVESNEDNTKYTTTGATVDDNSKGQSTAGLIATIKAADLTIAPCVLMTMAGGDYVDPDGDLIFKNRVVPGALTYGAIVKYKVSDVKLNAGIAMTACDVDEKADAENEAKFENYNTMSYKLGLGYESFGIGAVMATYTKKANAAADEDECALMCVTAYYKLKPAKGVVIKPLVKLITKKWDDDASAGFDEYSYIRPEIVVLAKF